MSDTLKNRAGALLAEAAKQGADEAQVTASRRSTTQIRYEKNDFVCTSANRHEGLGLRVHKDRRKGGAGTNESGASAMADVAARALTLAKYSLADEYLVLPEPSSPAELAGRWDESLAEPDAADLHALAQRFIAAASAEPRLSLDGGELSVTAAEEAIVNSHGLAVGDRATRLSWSLMGMGKTKTEVTSFDYLSGSSWRRGGADEAAEATARALVAKLVACFGPRSCPSYKGLVLLSPAVLGELIFQPLGFHVSGRQIMDGKSRWEKSLGEKVAAECFTLVDDPFDLALNGATPYDAEGVAVSRTPIVEAGVLKSHIDSTYTAKRRGTRSTGHAGGMHGISVAPGDKPREELLKLAPKLVVVERFSGNLDPVSGDFSGVAKGSHYYENGEHLHPLSETMIAGNFFDLLGEIVALSDAAEPFCNAYRAPWVLADGVSVTGG